MHGSRLFELLASFDDEDWKACRRQLLNGGKTEHGKLFNIIYQHKADLTSSKLSVDSLLTKIFKTVTRKSVLNLMSKLTKEIDEYMVVQEMKNDKHLYDLYKFKTYNRRGLYKRANKVAQELAKTLSAPQHVGIWNIWYRLALNHNHYFSYNSAKIGKPGKELLENSIKDSISLCERFLLFQRIEAINRKATHNEDWTETVDMIDSRLQLRDDTSIKCLRTMNKLLTSPSYELCDELTSYLFDKDISLDQDIQVGINIFIKRYLSSLINQGDKMAFEWLADFLYHSQMKGLLLHDGILPGHVFISCISSNVILGKWKRVQELMKNAQPRLSKPSSKEYMIIAQMKILHGQKKYKELSTYHADNFINTLQFNCYAKAILLQASYEDEQVDSELLTYQIRNFKDYLKRNESKLPSHSYRGRNNFLNILSLLNNGKSQNEITKRMNTMSENIFYVAWINEQFKKIK